MIFILYLFIILKYPLYCEINYNGQIYGVGYNGVANEFDSLYSQGIMLKVNETFVFL